MSNVIEKINEMHKAVSELRATNDQNIQQYDSLNVEKLANINADIDSIQSRIGTKSIDQNNVSKPKITDSSNIAKPKGLAITKQNNTIMSKVEKNNQIQLNSMHENQNLSFNDMVNEYLSEHSVIRQISSTVSTSNEYFDAIAYSDEIASNWSEGSSVADESNSFISKQIRVFDLTIQPKVTQRLLQDSEINFEEYLSKEAGAAIVNAENEVFIKGTGVNQPEGIISNPNIDFLPSEKTGDITSEAIINMYHLLDDSMSNDAVFVMNKSTVHKIRTLQDASGNYLWSANVLSEKSDTLLGMPLYTTNAMPNVSSGEKAILFGNFKRGYQIVDRTEIKVQEDPFTSKPYVIFFITKGIGGGVINPKAIISMKIN